MSQPKTGQLTIDQALPLSGYPNFNYEFLRDFMLDTYSSPDTSPFKTKVYLKRLGDKNFIVEYELQVTFAGRKYPVNLLLHFPKLFPDYPPQIFLEFQPGVEVNVVYFHNNLINQTDLRINYENLVKFDPIGRNINQIITAINTEFNKNFPLYKEDPRRANMNQNRESQSRNYYGGSRLDKTQSMEIFLKKEKFTDNDILNIFKKQVKDLIRTEYNKNNYASLNQNLKELNQINNGIKMQIETLDKTLLNDLNNNMINLNINNNNMNSNTNIDFQNLERIKNELRQIEFDLYKEVQELKTSPSLQEDPFNYCDKNVQIENMECFKFAVMQKVLEDYMAYLKKGYEKKVLNFHDCLNLTRAISRELFSINYIIKREENKNKGL